MHCSGVTYGSSTAWKPGCGDTAPVTRSAKADLADSCGGGEEVAVRHGRHGAHRPNPLVAAIAQALQSLMPAASKDATADPVATATATASATAGSEADPCGMGTGPTVDPCGPAAISDPCGMATAASGADNASDPCGLQSGTPIDAQPKTTAKEAAYSFAHELYRALRSVGGGNEGDACASWRTDAYGDLAQKLEALAKRLDVSASPAMATAPAAAATVSDTAQAVASVTAASPESIGNIDVGSEELGATAPVATDSVAVVTADASALQTPAVEDTTSEVHVDVPVAAQTGASESPLLVAFKQLLSTLNPNASTSEQQPESRLTLFLHVLASALQGKDEAQPAVTPVAGGLIDLTA